MSLQPPSLASRPKGGAAKTTKAVILVGGPSRGTRFRPLSMELPKVSRLAPWIAQIEANRKSGSWWGYRRSQRSRIQGMRGG